VLEADVVVGADGVWSTVRAHVGSGEPRYCGYAAVYGSGAVDQDSPVLAVDVHDLEPVDTWHRGRVVLLGDAAHAMAPTLGQGAAALEDAAVLVHRLRTAAGVEDALRAYTADRARRITRMTRQARQLGRLGQLTNPVGAWLRDRMMWLAGRFTGQDKPDDWLLGWHPPLPADRITQRGRGAT
jgi:2-polyprenyl-6-methoxyphenol hydroxylase-like FAD-dependent oxidoreductase